MHEVINFDSIEIPHDIVNKQIISNYRLPFSVNSTGYYREGKTFSCVHYGFNNYCVFLTLAGKGKVTYRGITKYLNPGDIMFTNNREVTCVEGAGQEFCFCFMNIVSTYCPYYDKLWNNGGFHVINDENMQQYKELIEKVNDNMNMPFLKNELLINTYITEFLSLALRKNELTNPPLYPQWLIDSIDYINKNYASEFKISELADRCFLDKTYFSRQFKKYLGKTPKEYQIQCRLEQAAYLLQTSDYSLTDIANMTGFSSQSFFTKLFKREYDAVPSEYRQKRTAKYK